MLLSRPAAGRAAANAFTLVEMSVATVILSVILLLVFSITQQAGDAWKNSAAKIESFQGARAAFESMTRRISQATLNTYYDYYTSSGERRTSANAASFQPAKYGRYSDLHFVTGKNLLNGSAADPSGLPRQVTHSIFFQAPTGYSDDAGYRELDATLNATGYYIEYAEDTFRPAFLNSAARRRFRLMQFSQPTQQLAVYALGPGAKEWFTMPLSKDRNPFSSDPRPARQIADNIVALVIHPKRSEKDAFALGANGELAPDYEYDSAGGAWTGGKQPPTQNQLPPLVEIVMVAVDEPSFGKLGNPSVAPDFGQDRLFKEASKLDDGAPSDLAAMEAILNATPGNLVGNKIKQRYQIFRVEVPIRSAKWSE